MPGVITSYSIHYTKLYEPVEEREPDRRSLLLRVLKVLLPPLLLIVAVLGSILGGFSSPTEAASVGAVGAMLLALFQRQLNLTTLKAVMTGSYNFV